MKYEDWIKYEEARKQQPGLFTWITYSDRSPHPGKQHPTNPQQPAEKPAEKKNLWFLVQQRFITRRI